MGCICRERKYSDRRVSDIGHGSQTEQGYLYRTFWFNLCVYFVHFKFVLSYVNPTCCDLGVLSSRRVFCGMCVLTVADAGKFVALYGHSGPVTLWLIAFAFYTRQYSLSPSIILRILGIWVFHRGLGRHYLTAHFRPYIALGVGSLPPDESTHLQDAVSGAISFRIRLYRTLYLMFRIDVI